MFSKLHVSLNLKIEKVPRMSWFPERIFCSKHTNNLLNANLRVDNTFKRGL